jgi:hypothetical protein
LKAQKPPKSLLNSQRMYRKLLDALDGMEKKDDPSTENTHSPYVEELDLFVTFALVVSNAESLSG